MYVLLDSTLDVEHKNNLISIVVGCVQPSSTTNHNKWNEHIV